MPVYSYKGTGVPALFISKFYNMKVSKALLGAILAGITIQAVSSCDKKQQDKITPAQQQAVSEQAHPGPNPNPGQEPCPACGMG